MNRRRENVWQRTAASGLLAALVGLFGLGCRSTPPEADPPIRYSTALYPGLPSTVAAPTVLPDDIGPPANAPAAQMASGVDRSPVKQAAFARTEPVAPVASQATEAAIDLALALRLAGVNNPTVNLARERVQEALAGQLAARSLLLPTLNVGLNFRHHSGVLQDDPGQIRRVNLQSFDVGLGTGAIGAGTLAIPGVRLFAHLGDAAYEPLAARQRVAVRRSDAQAVQNQLLLEVAVGYLNLIEAEARLEILERAESDVAEIARVAAEFARVGQGAPADANRTAANVELVRRQVRQAEGDIAIASARLCRLLNLDPGVVLHTPGGAVDQLRLLSEDEELESLLSRSLRSRPELAARAAAIQEAQTRVQQERTRPLLPTLSVGYSAGLFGGGGSLTNTAFNSLSPRSDFDVVAVWNVQNLGFGNRARIRTTDAGVGQSVAAYEVALNQVRQEVAAAQADAQAAARQIAVARSALSDAEDGFKLESERVRRGEGRPIEALDSFRQLLDTRLEVLRAVLAFNAAQFRLYVAVGNTPGG